LGSVPTSGLVFAAALAYEMLKPLIYVRKESKAHGSSKMIEGYINPGAKVLLIDDVATTGVSVSNAVHIIRANGGIVENVVTILDRLEGAEDKLKKINVKLIPITTINDIIDILYQKGLISNNNLKSVMHQINRDLDEY
jgi:orotate phosphoribosyltransferase